MFLLGFSMLNQKCLQFKNSYKYAVLGTVACLMGSQSALGGQIIHLDSRGMGLKFLRPQAWEIHSFGPSNFAFSTNVQWRGQPNCLGWPILYHKGGGARGWG